MRPDRQRRASPATVIGHRSTAAAALAIGLLSAASPHLAVADPGPRDPWTSCLEGLARSPNEYESAYCFYTAALERRAWPDGMRMFSALLREHPDNLWLRLAFGHMHRTGRPGADLSIAEQLYRQAADGFRAARHAEGEVLARINLRDILTPRGRLQDATAEVGRPMALGTSVTPGVWRARISTTGRSRGIQTRGDLGRACRRLKQRRPPTNRHGPHPRRRTCLARV